MIIYENFIDYWSIKDILSSLSFKIKKESFNWLVYDKFYQ